MYSISSIIIDGYNLIGLGHGDLQAARNRLIQDLADYRKKGGHEIIVVFDGWRSGGRTEERSTARGITVIYSRLGDKADLVIKRIISSEKREWIVVTSDRDIASHAWSTGSVPLGSELFEEVLAGRNPAAGGTETDDEDGERKRKGRSHTLSKKEKAIARVLKKL